MLTDPLFIPTREERRIRRWAIAFSIAAHTTAFLLILNYFAGRLRIEPSSFEPIATSEILDEEIARRLRAELTRPADHDTTAAASITTSIEPGADVIQSVIGRIVNYRDADTGPDPLATVRRNAELLSRISNQREVEKMAERLRGAMGVTASQIHVPTADTPPVDWNYAVQSDAKRVEAGERIEIHETFTDKGGGASTMIHSRDRDPATGEFAYGLSLIERGKRNVESRCTKDEFDAAADRVRPFELINQFPLLQELHRSAIVPFITSLSPEEVDEAAATQPANDVASDE